MLDAYQVRAARAMLDWSRADLSEASGISEEAIRNFERNINRPHTETVTQIRQAFEKQGIEFTANSGLRRKPDGVDILNGFDGLKLMLDEVYEQANKHGGQILITGVVDEDWVRTAGDYAAMHAERMTKIFRERGDMEVLVLAQDGRYETNYSTYCHYRYVPKEHFNPVPFYVYGDNLAIVVFQSDPAPRIILIRSAVVANAYRTQFMQDWQGAKEAPEKRKT